MARFARLAALALLLVPSAADAEMFATRKNSTQLMEVVTSYAPALASPDVLCSPCLQLGEQGLNILLNYILNAGVVGGCSKLCSNLKSQGEQTVCELACAVIGIKAFVKVLNNTDLDVFYFCEEVQACPKPPDDAAIQLVGAMAQPAAVVKGSDVTLAVALKVINASGLGEFQISVDGPVTQPISQGFVLDKGIDATTTSLAVKLTIQDDESSDDPVVWSPGTYTFVFEVCQGECGSKHPHSKVFGKQTGTFTLTEAMPIIAI